MRKAILVGVLILSLLSILVGCVVPSPTPTPPSISPPTTPSVPVKKIEVKYAKGFKVEYLPDGCKKVTDAEGQEFILIPRG